MLQTNKNKLTYAQLIKMAKFESITVWLGTDLEPLHAEAEKAGTTGSNLARMFIRDGLERLASGEISIIKKPVPFKLIDEKGKVFERGEMPAELYDRAYRAAEDQGVSIEALFYSAIKSAAEKLPA